VSARHDRRVPRVLRALLLAVAVVVALAGCTTAAYAPTPLPSAPPSATEEAAPAAPAAAAECDDPLASYAPPEEVPDPASLPAGSRAAEIRDRGRLVVGVSADSLLLGSRNPVSGEVEGFDIDMARLVAEALLGDPDAVELRVITAAERIPLLEEGSVDLVARNMTITCERWEQIAFSAEYYRSGQKVLVPLGSGATSLDDLAGQRVCAPGASTSLERLADFPDVVPVAADSHTDCLVRFQQGEVDAITGDDTVLAGLSAQDPYAQVVGDTFSDEPYGLGMNAEDVDLVRVVNAVLARAVADGSWEASYDRWLADALGPAPQPPTPDYGRG
jgi:polar amino acid transport system substrate-binding protein